MQPSSAGLALPVEVEVDANYDGTEALARVQTRRQGGVVLDGTMRVKVPVSALLDGADQRKSGFWEGSGSARLMSFPLASFPALAELQMAGLASGTLDFSGMGRDPEVKAELDLADVRVDRATFPRGKVVGRISRGGALISAKLDQAEGGASASASARVRWNSPFFPVLDEGAPVDLFAEARDLRAALLYPLLLRGVFAYFDGRVSGTLHLHDEPQGGKRVQTADGSFELREGSFQIPAIGQELQRASAAIIVQKNGEVLVNDVSADATSGRVTGSANLVLDGFRFARGEATVRVNKNEAIPLTLEGVSLGEAWGTLMLRAAMAGERTVNVDVDVPLFRTDIPESSSRDLQPLGNNTKIKTGMRISNGELVPLLVGPPQERRSEDALNWHLTFHLGQQVSLRRGSTMELLLGGSPVVDITDSAHVSGQIEFRGGKVEVFGKRFEVEYGTARFDRDDPGNPDVSVNARWDAPDGTRIYATFVGPLRTGVLSLHSEPVRPQNEVLSILLLGSSDSSEAAQSSALRQGSAQTAGAVLAGGAVTTSLNRVLSSVTPFDITTRVTTNAQGAQPEVAVQITPGVTAQVSYRTSPPNPAENPDRVLVTLDWRFRRNWSVVTTFGMATSVLDLIWQYRY
jgi:translocation and assembly module TamB